MTNASNHDESLTALYDGQCRLCRASSRWISALDWRRRIQFIDLRASDALPREDLMGEIHVHCDDQHFTGFDGIRRLLRELPLAMPLWLLLHLPGATWLGRRGYSWLARNRYRLSGLDCDCETLPCARSQ